MKKTIDATPSKIVLRYDYPIKEDGAEVGFASIFYIDGKFDRCEFDLGNGNRRYNKDEWFILSAIERNINNIQAFLNVKKDDGQVALVSVSLTNPDDDDGGNGKTIKIELFDELGQLLKEVKTNLRKNRPIVIKR